MLALSRFAMGRRPLDRPNVRVERAQVIRFEMPAPPTAFRYVTQTEWDATERLTRGLENLSDVRQTIIDLHERRLQVTAKAIADLRQIVELQRDRSRCCAP